MSLAVVCFAYQPPAAPDLPSPELLLVRLAVFTLGALSCAALAVWLARRRSKPAATEPSAEAPQVVASARLAGRCALHLLQVGDAHFVAATDASGLKAIQALPEAFEPLVEAAPGLTGGPIDSPDFEEDALSPRRLTG